MKRLVTMALAVCLLLTLVGCGGTVDEGKHPVDSETPAPVAEKLPPAGTLEIWTISQERWDIAGEIVELEQWQIDDILSEEPVVLPEEQQILAELRCGDTVITYSGTTDRPATATVVAIWESRCRYTRITLEDLRGTLVSAKLELPDNTSAYAATDDLPRLQTMLTGAKPYGGGGSCVFEGILTLAFDDGRQVTLAKATDGCPTFAFGGYACYTVSQSDNDVFWTMFGGQEK